MPGVVLRRVAANTNVAARLRAGREAPGGTRSSRMSTSPEAQLQEPANSDAPKRLGGTHALDLILQG